MYTKEAKGKKFFRLFLSLSAVLVIGLSACSKGPSNPAELRGGESRPTLSPFQFTGLTARAYEAAREIPEIIDSLYCYCDCEKHFGHKSLLSCYVDEHAVHCDVCQDEAIMALEMHRQGKDAVSIRKAVDERFSKLSH